MNQTLIDQLAINLATEDTLLHQLDQAREATKKTLLELEQSDDTRHWRHADRDSNW